MSLWYAGTVARFCFLTEKNIQCFQVLRQIAAMVIRNRGRVTGNPFLNFLREVRARPSNQGKTVSQISKLGAGEWSRMTNEAKEPFRKSALRYQSSRRSGRIAKSEPKQTRNRRSSSSKRGRSTSKRGRARSTARRRQTPTAPPRQRSKWQRQALAIALSMRRRQLMLERQEISRRRSRSHMKSTNKRRSRSASSAPRSRRRSKAPISQERWRVHKKAESILESIQRRDQVLEQRRGKSRPRSKRK